MAALHHGPQNGLRAGGPVPAGHHRPRWRLHGQAQGVRTHLWHRDHRVRHGLRRRSLWLEVPRAASVHLADLPAMPGHRHVLHGPRHMAPVPRVDAGPDRVRAVADAPDPHARADAAPAGRLPEDPLDVGGARLVRHVPHPVRDAPRRGVAGHLRRGGRARQGHRVRHGRDPGHRGEGQGQSRREAQVGRDVPQRAHARAHGGHPSVVPEGA
mmetsp:Transcript_38131/g.115277  ORF Transcript_38131/g.115277 Transcript_38131/m.115277 type:complete len:212 (-) Transcript_38131:2047-2682(-)